MFQNIRGIITQYYNVVKTRGLVKEDAALPGNFVFFVLIYIKWQGSTFVDAVNTDINPVFKYTGNQLTLCEIPPKGYFVGGKLLVENKFCSF